MALRSYPLLCGIPILLFALFSFEVSAALGSRKDALVSGWKPIKGPKDPYVVEIAKFAITEYNKIIDFGLVFERVVDGELQQDISGTNYKLVIAATSIGDISHQYEAVVWDKPSQKLRKLTSFKKIV